MKISILTLFPDLYKPFFSTSLVDRAQKKGIIEAFTYDMFSYAAPKERIDAPTFGHGAGMVIKPDIVEKAVTDIEHKHGSAYKIFFSPHGKKLNQIALKALFQRIKDKEKDHIMLLPARYEGMDARIEQEYADDIFSIGDFVLMGGDLPAMVLIESLLRFFPGVIGKMESVENDSFTGPFVDYPEYSAPIDFKGRIVPEVVRSGNHKALADWRNNVAASHSVIHHFDWVRSYPDISAHNQEIIKNHIPPHYVVLMHSDVLVCEDKTNFKIGTTSVTSLDIHDIARSSTTYGLKNYFIVTSLADQQTIVKTLLGFWQEGAGVSYNTHRHEAVSGVRLESSIDDVIKYIAKKEGMEPLLIATGAQKSPHEKLITFNDQEKVWIHKRPVLLVLGTGRGLSPELMQRCDYRFIPLEGFSSFNHLSVRSAAAIIFDKWLGKNPRYIKK